MKDRLKSDGPAIAPRRIRSYLTLNLALAVVMAVVLAVRTELKTGRFVVIDFLLFAFYSAVLASLFAGPIAVVESYLYRRNKGVWYEWKNRTRRPRPDRGLDLEERRYWKNEALRARLSQGDAARERPADQAGLVASGIRASAASRPAILLTLAGRFECSGKREAAARCYLQIVERFPNSPQAAAASRWLAHAPASAFTGPTCQEPSP